MKIFVDDYGVIKHAEIDLSKKLTLFCGGNGTGKTYMSYLTYAALSINGGGRLWPLRMVKIRKPEIDSFVKNNKISYSLNPKVLSEVLQNVAASIRRNIDELFGLSDEDAEKMFHFTKIRLGDDESSLNETLLSSAFEIQRSFGDISMRAEKRAKSLEVAIEIEQTPIPPAFDNSDVEIRLRFMLNEIYMQFVRGNISKAFILPVERNSIYTFNKELSLSRNNLIDEILQLPTKDAFDPFSYVRKASKRYPLAIKDAINIANDLADLKKHKGEYYDVALEIEKQLLGGSVDISSEGDVVFYNNSSSTKKEGRLPIHMTASLVKTLSSFIFFLKYQAHEGQLIIIDEPEMNFHPDSQIILVSIIVKLLHKGLRFLISTHSDYIIREFNKLMMLDAVRKLHLANAKIYPDMISLPSEDVNAYYFYFKNLRSKRVVVDRLHVDFDGICVPSIDKVVEAQNAMIDELSYKLHFEHYDNK